MATTENALDDAIEELSNKIGVKCFRGSEEAVLGRVLGAAKSVDADIIVELHGDCPFVDPDIISQVVTLYLNNQCDYAKNFEPSSYPDGLDAQAFSVDLLDEANRLGLTQEDREHVSWYFRKRPDVYKHLTILAPESLRFPNIRLTLDTAEDLMFIKTILPKLYAKNENFNTADLISELRLFGVI